MKIFKSKKGGGKTRHPDLERDELSSQEEYSSF